MGSTNLQSRKWLLTVNNPLDYGLNHAEIKNILHLFNPDYFCLVDEIATTGTRHTHIFIYSKSPIRFSTLKKRFPIAHIDKANGSVIENRDYLRKDGSGKALIRNIRILLIHLKSSVMCQSLLMRILLICLH